MGCEAIFVEDCEDQGATSQGSVDRCQQRRSGQAWPSSVAGKNRALRSTWFFRLIRCLGSFGQFSDREGGTLPINTTSQTRHLGLPTACLNGQGWCQGCSQKRQMFQFRVFWACDSMRMSLTEPQSYSATLSDPNSWEIMNWNPCVAGCG